MTARQSRATLLRVLRAELPEGTPAVAMHHPGHAQASTPRNVDQRLLEQVVRSVVPEAEVIKVSMAERMACCRAATGRDVCKEALDKVSKGDNSLSREAQQFGTPISREAFKLQQKYLKQEAGRFVKDDTKCSNASRARFAYIAADVRRWAKTFVADVLWNAVFVASQPAAAAASGHKRSRDRFRRPASSAEADDDASNYWGYGAAAGGAAGAGPQPRPSSQQQQQQQHKRAHKAGSSRGAAAAAAAAGATAAAGGVCWSHLCAEAPGEGQMPVAELQSFLEQQAPAHDSTAPTLSTCSPAALLRIWECRRLFSCGAALDTISSSSRTLLASPQQQKQRYARAVFRLLPGGGVPNSSSSSGVAAHKNKAYKALALLLHPDKVPPELQGVRGLFEVAFKVLQTAKEVLG